VTFVVLFCVLPWGPLGAAIATLAGNAAGCITRSWVLAAALKTIPHRLEAA
jgi:Na+-driven multidrug efflux pump